MTVARVSKAPWPGPALAAMGWGTGRAVGHPRDPAPTSEPPRAQSNLYVITDRNPSFSSATDHSPTASDRTEAGGKRNYLAVLRVRFTDLTLPYGFTYELFPSKLQASSPTALGLATTTDYRTL